MSDEQTADSGVGESDTNTSGIQRARMAKSRAIAATDGTPECSLCKNTADYFLFEAGRVERFVCWEHVSPHSAAVDGDPEETPEGRPVALEL